MPNILLSDNLMLKCELVLVVTHSQHIALVRCHMSQVCRKSFG